MGVGAGEVGSRRLFKLSCCLGVSAMDLASVRVFEGFCFITGYSVGLGVKLLA